MENCRGIFSSQKVCGGGVGGGARVACLECGCRISLPQLFLSEKSRTCVLGLVRLLYPPTYGGNPNAWKGGRAFSNYPRHEVVTLCPAQRSTPSCCCAACGRRTPFPSMPVCFWGDSDGSKYRSAYFEAFEGEDVWAHGDYIKVIRRENITDKYISKRKLEIQKLKLNKAGFCFYACSRSRGGGGGSFSP